MSTLGSIRFQTVREGGRERGRERDSKGVVNDALISPVVLLLRFITKAHGEDALSDLPLEKVQGSFRKKFKVKMT
jgi:hypothetical protein